MKTNKETARAFIQGKPANGSNFFTDGTTATSYTTQIAYNANGAILARTKYPINSAIYTGIWYGRTATTERQKSHIKSAAAAAGVLYFEVPHAINPTEAEHAQNLAYFENCAQDARNKASRARTERNRLFWQEEAERIAQEGNDYYLIFCL